MRSLRFFRWISTALIVAMTATTISAPAQAAMIATPDAAAAASARQRVNAFLARDDVAAKLQAFGVEPADAKARVAALSDEEVSTLAARMDALPAGGFVGDFIGALLLVFLVLLLTDILGYTKVFPFTRSVNNRK